MIASINSIYCIQFYVTAGKLAKEIHHIYLTNILP